MRKLIIGLGGMLLGLTLWSQGTDLEMAKGLLVEAENLAGDSKIEKLIEAVEISEKISFDEGVRNGYQGLIEMYAREKKVPQELQTRLQLVNYLDRTEDQLGWANAEYDIGELYFEQGIYANAAESFSLSRKKAAEIGEEELFFRALLRYARAQHELGNDRLATSKSKDETLPSSVKSAFREARNSYTQALALAKSMGKDEEQLWIHQQMGRIAHVRKQHNEELSETKSALAMAKKLGRPHDMVTALNNMVFVSKFLGQPKEALDYFTEAHAILQASPDAGMEADVLLNLGVIRHNQGDLSLALKHFQTSAKKAIEAGNEAMEGNAYDFLARGYYQSKDYTNALSYNERTIKVARANQLPELLLRAYATRSLIYQSLYEFEYAVEAQKKFLELNDSLADLRQMRRAEVQTKEREMHLMVENDLKIVQYELQRQRDEEEKKRLEQELELESSELARKGLEAQEAKNELALTEQQAKISNLANQRIIQDLELDKERSKAETERVRALQNKELAKRLENEKINEELRADNEQRLKELQMQENDRQAENIRNLIFILIGAGLMILFILIVLGQLRLRNKKIKKQQLEIAASKQKSDELLLNILPITVAEELKESGQSPPRYYEEATVLFTDFAGFTQISERLSPAALVETLDKVFLQFDLIAEKHGLQRIKTIGDAYMATCGLPEADPDHASKTVAAALEMRDFIREFNANQHAGADAWNIRIGVNSGPVVAGVVGIRKFAYDIWGDTVNTASRMESSGAPGKVNISGSTQNLVKQQFQLEYRGKVSAKNKGEIDMYFAEAK